MNALQRVSQGDTPSVVSGILAYALFVVLTASFGLLLMLIQLASHFDGSTEWIAYDLLGLFLITVPIAIHLVPLLGRRTPWHWWYNLFVIVFSFSSCLMLPFSIAMLIYWLDPETKAFYGKA